MCFPLDFMDSVFYDSVQKKNAFSFYQIRCCTTEMYKLIIKKTKKTWLYDIPYNYIINIIIITMRIAF